jgi:hypothetical protein
MGTTRGTTLMYADVINDWKGLFAAFDVLFTVLAFGGIGALLRLPYPKGPHGASRSPEENRLFKKFANGEIDDDEYRRRRETIRISAAAARPALIRSWGPGNRADSQLPSMTGSARGCGGGVTADLMTRSSGCRS